MAKKIKVYKVEITDGSGIIGRGLPENTFTVEEFNVIAENKVNLVIDDISFTTLRLLKSDYMTCLDKPYISINNGDKCWGNRVSYTLYTEGRKTAKKIRAEIEAKLEMKFGFFRNGLDLSFIKDGAK
jgi:hypothetical protein